MSMSHLKFPIGIFLTAMVLGSPAFAVDIENTDERDYEVTVVTGDDETSTTITVYSGTTEENVCTTCKIKIEGVGEVDAQEGDDYEISGGKLTAKSD